MGETELGRREVQSFFFSILTIFIVQDKAHDDKQLIKEWSLLMSGSTDVNTEKSSPSTISPNCQYSELPCSQGTHF